MADISRREFVSTSLMAAMFGVRGLSFTKGTKGTKGTEGELLGIVPFVDEGSSPIGTLIAGSHRGRLVADLAKLDETKLVTPNDEFFIRTRYPDELKHDSPWTLRAFGHVRQETTLTLDDLRGDVVPMGLQLLECSGNSKRRKFGLLSSAEWSGIPIAKVLVPRIFNYYTKSGSPCVSSVRWAKRAIDSRIWSADLVHLNGFGSSLWASR